MTRRFRQVDVFTTNPMRGNPVAVVHDSEGLETATMQQVAAWTNLSETTFLVPPHAPGADYAVRIFQPDEELPFAGHPTLGTCHTWLEAGGVPADPATVIQECEAGLIRIRRTNGTLAFAAPPLIRSGPVSDTDVGLITEGLGISRSDIVDLAWADNGPGWVAVLLESADAVRALRPGQVRLDIGVVGFEPPGSETAIEVRAFFPVGDVTVEDPVTGSLNASVAMWLRDSGRLTPPYVAAQGTALDRTGRVHVSDDVDGTIWVGGGTVTCIEGTVDI